VVDRENKKNEGKKIKTSKKIKNKNERKEKGN